MSIQLELRGTVVYRSLSPGDETLEILQSWKDSHLTTSGHTLQVNYIGTGQATTQLRLIEYISLPRYLEGGLF